MTDEDVQTCRLFGITMEELEESRREDKNNTYDKFCACCKAKIGRDYNFSDYVYKFNEYSQKDRDYVVRFFCSWTCYRKYLKERGQNE